MNQLDLLKQLEKTDFSSISSFGDFSKLMGMLNQIEDRSVFAQFQEKIKDHPMFKEFQKTQGETLAEQRPVMSAASARLAELMEKRSTSRENTRQQQANNVVQQATYQHAMISSWLDNSREPDGSYNIDKLIFNILETNKGEVPPKEVLKDVVKELSKDPNWGSNFGNSIKETAKAVGEAIKKNGSLEAKDQINASIAVYGIKNEIEMKLGPLSRTDDQLFDDLMESFIKDKVDKEEVMRLMNKLRDKFPDIKELEVLRTQVIDNIDKGNYQALKDQANEYAKGIISSVGSKSIESNLMDTTAGIDKIFRYSLGIAKDVDHFTTTEESWQRKISTLKEMFEGKVLSGYDEKAFNPTKLMFNDITGTLLNYGFISKDGKILEGRDINALIKKIENDGDVPAATLLLAQLNSPLIRTVMAIQPPERGLEALNAITGWDKITQAQFDIISQIHKEIKPSTREILKKWEQSEVVQNSFYETVKEDGVIKMKRELHKEVSKERAEREEMNYVASTKEVEEKVAENTKSSLSEDVPTNEQNNKLAEIKDYDKQVMTTVAKDGGEIPVNNNEYNAQKLSI